LDAVYHSLVVGLGLSPVNTTLLAIIFYLVRQRLALIEETVKLEAKRNDRIEKSLYRAGIDLLEME